MQSGGWCESIDKRAFERLSVQVLYGAALSCGFERFIFTSTMGTLGIDPQGPVTEDVEFNCYEWASLYILARLQAEKIFLRYCREKGLPGMALCVANTYGPED